MGVHYDEISWDIVYPTKRKIRTSNRCVLMAIHCNMGFVTIHPTIVFFRSSIRTGINSTNLLFPTGKVAIFFDIN